MVGGDILMARRAQRERVLTQIVTSAATVLERPAGDLRVVVAPVPATDAAGFEARVDVGDAPSRIVGRDASEDEALETLLSIAVELENAGDLGQLILRDPGLERAFKLLRMTRRELLRMIREEAEARAPEAAAVPRSDAPVSRRGERRAR